MTDTSPEIICDLGDLRYYAGLALQGIMANPVYFNHTTERIAEDAIEVAKTLTEKLAHVDYLINNSPKEEEQQSSIEEEILTIENGRTFVDDVFHGKTVRFVGKVVINHKNNITVELVDDVGSMFTVHMGNTPVPESINSEDLYYVYTTVNTKENGWKYLYKSIEPYVKLRDGQLTVESAIELIEQGKAVEVITVESEDVFKNNREAVGDRRAAWKALEYSLLAHGIQKQEVEDRTSTNQFESISQLIVDYLFSKYQQGN